MLIVRRATALLATCCICLFVFGCGGGSPSDRQNPGPITLVGLSIEATTLDLHLGNSYQFSLVANYSDGSSKDQSSEAQWGSSDEAILRNLGAGLFSTLAAGSAKITASSGGMKASVSITSRAPILQRDVHSALTERYISAANVQTTFFLRRRFSIDIVPQHAFLYIAGPFEANLFVNGSFVGVQRRRDDQLAVPNVYLFDVTKFIATGQNVIAIIASGGSLEVAAKLMSSQPGRSPQQVLVSDGQWRVSTQPLLGWETTHFDDSSWALAQVGAGLEDDPIRYQSLFDTELHVWPGYDGISPFLAHETLMPMIVEQSGGISSTSNGAYTVSVPSQGDLPYIFFDLGRETNGRIRVRCGDGPPCSFQLHYGESVEEAWKEPYLGVRQMTLLPNSTGYGHKQGFRYVLLKFRGPAGTYDYPEISVDGIYYPATWIGSFESSDPQLNQAWYTGMRTAHLVMQDFVWDGIKRDRMIWAGDLYVTNRALQYLISDKELTERTLSVIAPAEETEVNNIAGYTAYWIMTIADRYRRDGDLSFVESMREPLARAVDKMAGNLDSNGMFSFPAGTQMFVDWSPDLFTDSIESRRATQFLLHQAFRDAAWLFQLLGDDARASSAIGKANLLRDSALQWLATGATFGERWQPNALAVTTGIADGRHFEEIGSMLASPPQLPVTPFQNYFAISAMAELDRRGQALDWIRKYWGGMLAQGATSFWESYDLGWEKDDFHSHLEAVHGPGYYVSLCHGWSGGVSAWLSEEILGVKFTDVPGLVTIRPDLAGLSWARGRVPVPGGAVEIEYSADPVFRAKIVVPAGSSARVTLPVAPNQQAVRLNGEAIPSMPAEKGTRRTVSLDAGTYSYKAE